MIEHGDSQDPIWDLEWFEGALYVSTDSAIFRLSSNQELEMLDTKLGDSLTCGSLAASDSYWS